MTPNEMAGTSIGLILAGGIGLGAFQAGLFEALQEESGLRIEVVAGSSIGAINGAIIAGNAPENRLAMLSRFWQRVETETFAALPNFMENDGWHKVQSITSTIMARIGGVPGLLRPSAVAFTKAGCGPSLYDASPTRQTLEELVDFGLLNSGSVRFCLCATDIETGEPVFFDTHAGDRITPAHILASGALMPNLPVVEIDGRFFSDGGLSANAPMEPFLSSERQGDLPRWMVLADLFTRRGAPPQSLAEAAERANDLKYAMQTHVRLAGLVRERRLEAAAPQKSGGRGTDLIVVDHHEPDEPSRMEKVFDFSRATLRRRWFAGREAAQAALEQIRKGGAEAAPGLRVHDLT
ncbi:patatin [Sphingobium sp. SCG-1]|uniref:patatin-like phospholipase family protein n=1 Tax=Sphingobium sp. SCG-1 TaxID=2072936 RepID=UPI000CD6A206|nr:patatin-like phospholipase family protein [Sphingobium sp. SCG-1]AUW57305.1 patatin [Sphingobium sp. SCG-1]